MPKVKKTEDEGVTGATSLHNMLHVGENIKTIGTMFNVPFSVLGHDKSTAEGGTLQRGLHDNSVTETSIRKNGWRYEQGSPMLAMEVVWTKTEWDAAIAAGKYASGTPMPDALRSRTWPVQEGGLASIVIPDDEWRMRRFIMDDGNHRVKAMNTLREEKHSNAIEHCERGCLLLDCDPVEDRSKCMHSSMLANVKQLEVDKDFLADKLGQIKGVNTHSHTRVCHLCSFATYVIVCLCAHCIVTRSVHGRP